MSFVASANAISLTGATPVFADVKDDFNICPSSIKKLITNKTKAIMPIHYGGKIADMNEINAIADEFNLQVIEDASQAFGAQYYGKYAGTLSHIGAISLNSMKILAALGDAGLILLNNNDKLYKEILSLRYNGLDENKACQKVSTNAKMDTIQAAVLLERINTVDLLIKRRREIASKYTKSLFNFVRVPTLEKHKKDVYFTYTILTEHRDTLLNYLTINHIEAKIYHTNLMDENAYKKHKGECKNARQLSKKKLALPCHENMSNSQVSYVIDTIISFFNNLKKGN